MRRVVVVGAGGFGREVIDVLQAVNRGKGTPELDLVGVLDDGPSDLARSRLAKRGVPLLASVHEWLSRGERADFVVGIGNPRVRRRLAALLQAAGCRAVTVVHPSAIVGSEVSIGAGAVVCAGVNVSTNVRLDDHVHLGAGAIIGHDTHLKEFVSVNPGAIVSGDCVIEPGALIGAGAVVREGLTVGPAALVGAAACVVRQVPADTVVRGVPAR